MVETLRTMSCISVISILLKLADSYDYLYPFRPSSRILIFDVRFFENYCLDSERTVNIANYSTYGILMHSKSTPKKSSEEAIKEIKMLV